MENLWCDSPKEFEEQYNTNISTVLNDYKFENEGISFSRSYSYEPPLDYISVSIRIYDQEDDYVAEYRALYDLDLHIFDDTMTKWESEEQILYTYNQVCDVFVYVIVFCIQ